MNCIFFIGGIFVVIASLLVHFTTTPECTKCVQISELRDEYDFIVVGAGTAGSIIASELIRQTNFTVLLIEAGGPTNTRVLSLQSVPGLSPKNAASGSIDWNFKLQPQTAPLIGEIPSGLHARTIPIPRGRVLGGSNELNFMLHLRATDGDFNTWAAAAEDDSWNSTYMQDLQDAYEKVVSVGLPEQVHPMSQHWVAAGGLTAQGNMSHCNDGKRQGTCHFQHSILKGARHSTARAYLWPLIESIDSVADSRLHVLLDASVTKVIIDTEMSSSNEQMTDLIARGVEVNVAGSRRIIRAEKEVVLAAGTYQSPQILMLSGVGPRDHLEAVGIPVVRDLPGVGSHLQDHPLFPVKIRFGDVQGRWWPRTITQLTALGNPWTFWNYFTKGIGILSTSCVDIGWFHSSNSTYAHADTPDLQMHVINAAGDFALFNDAFKYREDVFGPDSVGQPEDWGLFAEGIAVAPTLLHPSAVGSVRLGSADPSQHPIISYEAFSQEDDVDRLIQILRHLQELLRQAPLQQFSPLILPHHALAAQFTFDSDQYWRQFIKRFGMLVYHPTGTCKMGSSRDAMAVVDSQLRVRGVGRLRISDASVMPELSSGNTNTPTAAIALKMVSILVEQYGHS